MKPWILDLSDLGYQFGGYIGGFTDGRNAYLVPHSDGGGTYLGRIVRLNIDKFTLADTAAVDITAVDGNARGFAGGFTDGRYGYLAPYINAGGKHGRIARIDLQNFTTGGVTILDLQSIDSALAGFWGAFTDGRYGYFIPIQNDSGPHGKLVRVDLDNFATGGVTVLDLATVDAGLVYMLSGFTDGRYAWLVARGAHGKVARVDLSNFSPGGVTVLDLATIDPSLVRLMGSFSDGRYGYVLTYDTPTGGYAGKVARLDLANFSASGVTVLDLTMVDTDLRGYIGSFTDGRYAWLAPYAGTKAARLDLANFTASGVSVVDLSAFDTAATKYESGFTNGQYGVMVPFRSNFGIGSKLVRIQMFQGPGSL